VESLIKTTTSQFRKCFFALRDSSPQSTWFNMGISMALSVLTNIQTGIQVEQDPVRVEKLRLACHICSSMLTVIAENLVDEDVAIDKDDVLFVPIFILLAFKMLHPDQLALVRI
jgi:hypothetical protein